MSSERLLRRNSSSSTSSDGLNDFDLPVFTTGFRERTTLGMRTSVTTSLEYAQITVSCVGTLAVYNGRELMIRSPFKDLNPHDHFSTLINGKQPFRYRITSPLQPTLSVSTGDTWSLIYVPFCSSQVNKNLPERMLTSQVELFPLTPMAWGSPVLYTPFDQSSYGYLHEDDDINLVIIVVDLNYRRKRSGPVQKLSDLCRRNIFDARKAGTVTFNEVDTLNLFYRCHATSTICSNTSFASVRYVGANSVSLGTLAFSDDLSVPSGAYSLSSATFNAISNSAIRLTRIAKFTSS